MHKLPWIDLETGGLDPATCITLEVGCFITDEEGEILDRFERVIKYADIELQEETGYYMDKFAFDMHKKSGLLEACVESDTIFSDVTADWIAFLQEHNINENEHPMCGSSVGFDRGFILQDWPAIHGRFHYRNIDVSSTNEIIRRRRPELYARMEEEVPKRNIHRVAPDLEDTIAMYRWHLENVFV